MLTVAAITERISKYATDAGFELSGIVPLPGDEDPGFHELKFFPDWIERGYAGEMEYLKARNEQGELKRAALRNVAPWAKSVVVCAINYNSDRPYSTEMRDSSRGWISRYAWFETGPHSEKRATDYHDAVLARLRTVEAAMHSDAHISSRTVPLQTRCYVDTGPLVERVYAKYAGIGWLAKNTCLINQEFGSWLFLGTILASLELTRDEVVPASLNVPADRCGSCTRCLEACPTGALIAPYKMDATRCIAYLTIEKRGNIPEEFRAQIGNNIFGCDICQDVCPWNGLAPSNAGVLGKAARTMPVTGAAEFHACKDLVAPPLERIATMTKEEFNQTFRGSPIKRTKYQGIRRNVAIAMGNSEDEKFAPLLRSLAADEDENVAEHARWALQKLNISKTT